MINNISIGIISSSFVVQGGSGETLPYSNDFTTNPLENGWEVQTQLSEVTNGGVWTWNNSTLAGGTASEMGVRYTDAQITTDSFTRLVSVAINTSGKSSISVAFKINAQLYSPPSGYFFRVLSSTDKINWTEEYNNEYTANVGIQDLNVTCNNNIGSTTYISFEVLGNLYNLGNYCSIDNLNIT